jgi:hypothetical protein
VGYRNIDLHLQRLTVICSSESKRRNRRRMAINHENGESLKEAFKELNDVTINTNDMHLQTDTPQQPPTPRGYAHSEVYPAFGRPISDLGVGGRLPSVIREIIDYLSEESTKVNLIYLTFY